MIDDNGDEIELDDDILNDLENSSPDNLQPEDLFKMTTINRARHKQVKVEIQDETGATIKLADIIQELLNYIKVKSSDTEDNQFMGQIIPLMSQSVASGLGRMIGIRQTAFYLSDDTARYAFIHMMSVAFLMLKFVQQKKLVINTYEEDVTDEEIENMERKSKANSVAMLGALVGQNPREVLETLRNQGSITDQDIRDMLGEKK